MPDWHRAEARRVVDDLRTLAARTSTPDGAQRVAWGPVWREARQWFLQQADSLGLTKTTDAAGNNWFTLPGDSRDTVIVGGHLDSVPNGGWLDGALRVTAGRGGLRLFQRRRAPLPVRLVGWAAPARASFRTS